MINELLQYSELDQDDGSCHVLLQEPEWRENVLPGAPPPQKEVLFCPLPHQVNYFKWWLTKCFMDYVDIFQQYAEMGNDDHTEMQLEFQVSQNPSAFVTTPKVGGPGTNLTAVHHAVITQKFRVLNDNCQAFE